MLHMTIIETKWVFRNKLDENGIVSRNKARLVAQGYNQQEGVNYDEPYAPVARLESIRILLAYACALDFKLFQMDVKSAFLNGFINEEVYVAQPPGFIDFEKSDHVYKLNKALYGLNQAPKTCVCLCARFQEDPKTSHLEAVKRIFRYIKGTTHLGLWYPKGTDIETVVYVNSDHEGDYVDRKSTSGICTFMGCCLTSWFSKKQTALAISTTEAKYVSIEKACQQALWMKQALIEYDVRLDDVPIMRSSGSCLRVSLSYAIPYNLEFFILKRMEKTRNKPKELLPYGMLLTRFFLNHGKKRPRDSNASSSSATLNHLSSFHQLDDIVDENDEESFRSNSSSPSQNISSSSNVVSRVLQNPPHKSQHLNTYLSKTINLQT
ncbi:copia protein [Tanacetum coccineum]